VLRAGDHRGRAGSTGLCIGAYNLPIGHTTKSVPD
jgi:hypothetical protein